jgi:nucleoside-diphosphate-sugar epimerase
MGKAILTGASGFIGSHILRCFTENRTPVNCLVRKESDLSGIDVSCTSFEYADIRDLSALTRAFAGKDSVIHTAAYAHDWGDYRIFWQTNVIGTLNVLKACRANGIRDIIITGTVSSYGEEHCECVKDETWPENSHYHYFFDRLFPCKMNWYRDTKAQATREAVKYAEAYNMNLTILEPVWVYGEREFNTGFYSYLKAAAQGIPALPGSKKNHFHVIYAGDLARAFLLAYQKKPAGVNRMIIGSEQADLMDDIYSLFCIAAGIRKPYRLPKYIAYPAGFLMEAAYTAARAKHPPVLTRGRVNMFYDNIGYSVKKAGKILGFHCSVPLDEGIRKTVAWYKENNLL